MISPTEELHWRMKGYVIPNYKINLSESSIIHDVESYYKRKGIPEDFGDDNKLSFPSEIHSINEMAVNGMLLATAGQLLNGPPILIQMQVWAKKGCKPSGPQSNQNQRMHMDYGNNTFVHPPPFVNPSAVSLILYLSDTELTGGGTAVVPRNGLVDEWYKSPYTKMPGQAGLEFINDKDSAETMLAYEGVDRSELYEREIIPSYDIGECLWYRHDTWHRGTPVRKGKIRYVVSMAWKKKDSVWLTWNAGFAKKMYYGWMEQFISTLNPYQLYSIGFPHPLDPYWCSETIAGTQARYQPYGFDINKYLTSSII